MAKKLTEEDWENFSKDLDNRSFRYKILDVSDGKVTVEFIDTIYETSQGEEDLLGNLWKKDWSKIEARVFFNGEPCVLSFGWRTSPFFRTFRARCQENGIKPDDLPGTVWEFEKSDANRYNIKYKGRGSKKELTVEVPDKSYEEVISVISSLKEEPEILEGGIEADDFVKAIAIRTNNKVNVIKKMLPKLEKEKIIKIDNERVFLI